MNLQYVLIYTKSVLWPKRTNERVLAELRLTRQMEVKLGLGDTNW